MSTYIDELKIPKCKNTMKFAYPKPENGSSAINLICGENYTGKSFVLSKIRSLYEKRSTEQLGFTIKYISTGSNNENNAIFFGKVWKHNDKCGGYTFDSKKLCTLRTDLKYLKTFYTSVMKYYLVEMH